MPPSPQTTILRSSGGATRRGDPGGVPATALGTRTSSTPTIKMSKVTTGSMEKTANRAMPTLTSTAPDMPEKKRSGSPVPDKPVRQRDEGMAGVIEHLDVVEAVEV